MEVTLADIESYVLFIALVCAIYYGAKYLSDLTGWKNIFAHSLFCFVALIVIVLLSVPIVLL